MKTIKSVAWLGFCLFMVHFLATTSYALETAIICYDSTDCLDASQYCAKAPDDCLGYGVCEPKPQQCIMLFDPVCGCDGNTYGNECEAAAAGVNVAGQGECNISNKCSTNADCLATEYCVKVDGKCFAEGYCKERPELCPLVYDPVCGCDGNTYGNECEAAVIGVNVNYKGQCAKSVCFTNADCTGPEEYCAKGIGECDGGFGVCETMPELCTMVYEPVCGCDGSTYSNACEAASLGFNISDNGACMTDICVAVADNEKGRRCADGLDNDCDGVFDCNDPDCINNKACK